MKKIILLALFFCTAVVAHAQLNVSGQVLKTNGDTVRNASVYIYCDTAVGPATFTPRKDTTDNSGQYSFSINTTGVPVGQKYFVATLNCDSLTLKTNALTYTGNNNVVSTLIVCVTANTSFSGYVHLGDAGKRPPVKDAWVYLVKKCGNVLTPLRTVETDTNGYFHVDSFPKMASGCELIMTAELKPASAEYKKYFPAYHNGNTNYSLQWLQAKEIPYLTAKDGINILLPKAINPTGGPSKISGYALEVGTGIRLKDKKMLLTDMHDVPVDFTYTDQIGNFSFGNLPFGTYKLFGDVWSKDNPALQVAVSADHVNETAIIFREFANIFEGSIATSITGANGRVYQLLAYPNPARDFVTIKGAENIPGGATVLLTDVTGRVVRTARFGQGSIATLPMGEMVAGMYLLHLQTESGSVSFKIAK